MAKKNITITLKLGELLYDVQNRTHLAGRDREDARAGAHIQATDDEESSNAVKRGLQRALSRVRQAVNEWAHIDAIVNDNTRLINLAGDLPSFAYNGAWYANGDLHISSPADTLKCDLSLQKIMDDGNRMALSLQANAANNKRNEHQ
jgi:hypothetical protein